MIDATRIGELRDIRDWDTREVVAHGRAIFPSALPDLLLLGPDDSFLCGGCGAKTLEAWRVGPRPVCPSCAWRVPPRDLVEEAILQIDFDREELERRAEAAFEVAYG